MSPTDRHLASVRAVQAAVVVAATAVGFATGGAEAAFIAAVIGFFGVKSVESLQRALP